MNYYFSQISNVIDIALYYQDEISFNVNHMYFDLKIIEIASHKKASKPNL